MSNIKLNFRGLIIQFVHKSPPPTHTKEHCFQFEANYIYVKCKCKKKQTRRDNCQQMRTLSVSLSLFLSPTSLSVCISLSPSLSLSYQYKMLINQSIHQGSQVSGSDIPVHKMSSYHHSVHQQDSFSSTSGRVQMFIFQFFDKIITISIQMLFFFTFFF